MVPALALVGAAALFMGLRFAEQHPGIKVSPAQTVRFRMAIPEGMKLSESQTFSLSPDGRTLVYLASAPGEVPRLRAQSLDSLEPRLLPGTESIGGDPQVFWSPDSKAVVFYANQSLKRTDLSGNPPQVICSVPGIVLGGSWNREGTIIFGTTTGGIMRVPAAGGEAVPVTTRDLARAERVHAEPTFLPDGRHFVYSRLSSVPENNGIFVGTLDAKPGEQEQKRLVATPFGAQFVVSPDGNGKLLFLRDSTLWAQDFDASRRELKGEPALVAEHVGSVRAFGFFSASTSGALVHRSGLRDISRLTWFDPRGQRLASVGEPVDLEDAPVLSPDGARIAMARFDGGGVDVWVHDLTRDVSQRLTFDPALDSGPVWSPDGKRIAYSSSRSGHYDLYQVRANGEGREELLYASAESKFASSWSPDGRFLIYGTQAGVTNGDIWALPLDSAGTPTPLALLHTRANEGSGKLSPDGRWLAYVSDESGVPEVYVQPFEPRDSPAGPKLLVSRGGGHRPQWRADGLGLFYHATDGTLMSVTLQGSAADPKPSVPRALFHLPGSWDAAGDGRRFLAAVPEAQTAQPYFTVVLNWQAELKPALKP
jgi:eukaryotic-like serine/threonine-protein kinase